MSFRPRLLATSQYQVGDLAAVQGQMVSAMHGVLIISARRQFPPGATVAGSPIYIKTRGMVGYAVSGRISPT